MSINKLLLTCVILVCLVGSNDLMAQVELSKETTKEKKKEEKKKERKNKETDGVTSLYLSTNWSYTTRKLIENDGYFGDSLGARADETGIGNWSFAIGFRNQLNDYLAWEGGVAFYQNGEQYNFEGADTLYRYQSKYMYIAVPIKVYFTYGSSFKLLAGVGLVPQMFVGYRQDLNYKSPLGEEISEEIKLKSGYNPFVVSASFNLGTEIQLSESWSVLILPEYKLQLNSTFEKNDSYKHFGRSLGVNVGFTVKL